MQLKKLSSKWVYSLLMILAINIIVQSNQQNIVQSIAYNRS
jgi:hypothetical protein